MRNKIEILACLITHQLNASPCSLLLSLFLAASAALADHIAVQMNLYGKMLVVVGAAFPITT